MSEITTTESKDMAKLLKEMYGKDLTDLEFKTLTYMAQKYDLDPVQNEIWAIKYNNRPAMIMTGRDGFLAIAHKSGEFDGMETKAITKDGNEVLTCLDNDELAGAVCRVWRKDMKHPIVVAVALKEYNTHQSNWKKMPETMIKKVAESQALRRAFNVSGMYSPEEMDQAREPAKVNTNNIKKKMKSNGKDDGNTKLFKDLPKNKQIEIATSIDPLLKQIAEETDGTIQETKEQLLNEWYGVTSRNELTVNQCRELYTKLKEKLREVQQV